MFNKKYLINVVIFVSIIPLFFTKCYFLKVNEAPIIDSLFILEKHDLAVDDTLHIICSAYDPDEDLLEYTWMCLQGGVIIASNKDTSTLIINDTLLNINCSVNDISEASTSKNLKISLSGDSNPIIDSLYVTEEPGLANIGDHLHLVCEAHHPKGASLEYIWSTNSGALSANGDQAILEVSEYTAIEVNCIVKDNYDSTAEQSFTFNIPSEIIVQGKLKANYSNPDSLLCNIPFMIQYHPAQYIYYGFELEASSDGTFSFTWTKPLANCELVIDPYYVNLPEERSYRKSILVEDFKKINENNYKLNIILDIPSTYNYYNYFPFSVGNKWVYKSTFGAPDDYLSHNIEGVETWKITEINETKDTLIMDVDYQGMKYNLRQMSSTSDNDTTDKEIINIHARYKLFIYGNFIRYFSTESKDGFNTSLVPIGENIFKYGLPFKFETIEDTEEFKIPFCGWFYGYHTVAYGIGLTNFHSSTHNYYPDGESFILDLLSFDFNE